MIVKRTLDTRATVASTGKAQVKNNTIARARARAMIARIVDFILSTF